jgi:hypothetical protein
MQLFTTAVPLWVSISLVLSMPIPIVMIANLAKTGIKNANLGTPKANKTYWSIIIFYAIYLSYVTIMSLTGVFAENALPPKLIVLTSLPLLLFFMIVVSNLSLYKTILQNTSLQSLVHIHIFRLIGVFFLIVHAYGAIPARFAYIGGIGDIATALSAIIVAKSIANKKPYAIPLTFIWNIFGLLDIISVVATALITTRASIETGSQSVIEMTKFPFAFIPAFAAATIIFLHVSVFRKLRSERLLHPDHI